MTKERELVEVTPRGRFADLKWCQGLKAVSLTATAREATTEMAYSLTAARSWPFIRTNEKKSLLAIGDNTLLRLDWTPLSVEVLVAALTITFA